MKLSQCIFHGKEFLVMHWIITLSCLQRMLLITDDALCAVCSYCINAQPIAESLASQTTWNALSWSAIVKMGDCIKLCLIPSKER